MIYWDTSCVIKLYTEEGDSGEWQQRACDAQEQLVSSSLMRTESAFALEQKEHRGDILCGGATALLEILDQDIAAGRFNLFPVGEDVLNEAVTIAETCYHASPVTLLRTPDGIHLATARLLRCTQIAAADDRMRTAAETLGLTL
ncbi:MAG: type II toxin-antitoxin system VapC family toxin, partial [Kiritimatiellae bacterium]|nr:type II toxin-antitoxin system VapC family toxin [Kiritimatiellia bacterium]